MVSARYLPFMGGIETHIHEVGSRLVAQGHTVVVLTTDPTWNLPPTETVSPNEPAFSWHDGLPFLDGFCGDGLGPRVVRWRGELGRRRCFGRRGNL